MKQVLLEMMLTIIVSPETSGESVASVKEKIKTEGDERILLSFLSLVAGKECLLNLLIPLPFHTFLSFL